MASKDGGELGRGARRNAQALQGSIDDFRDKFIMLKGLPEELSHPLEGMPKAVVDDLKAVSRELELLLRGAP